jgi:hypothetical protein
MCTVEKMQDIILISGCVTAYITAAVIYQAVIKSQVLRDNI